MYGEDGKARVGDPLDRIPEAAAGRMEGLV